MKAVNWVQATAGRPRGGDRVAAAPQVRDAPGCVPATRPIGQRSPPFDPPAQRAALVRPVESVAQRRASAGARAPEESLCCFIRARDGHAPRVERRHAVGAVVDDLFSKAAILYSARFLFFFAFSFTFVESSLASILPALASNSSSETSLITSDLNVKSAFPPFISVIL